MLCHESSGCMACNNDDYHRSRQRQTVNISVSWIRISVDNLQ